MKARKIAYKRICIKDWFYLWLRLYSQIFTLDQSGSEYLYLICRLQEDLHKGAGGSKQLCCFVSHFSMGELLFARAMPGIDATSHIILKCRIRVFIHKLLKIWSNLSTRNGTGEILNSCS